MRRRTFDERRLLVDPHTYIAVTGPAVLVYSSLSGSVLWAFNAPRIARFCADLLAQDSMAFDFSRKSMARDTELQAFVDALQEGSFVDVVDACSSSCLPVLPPITADVDSSIHKRSPMRSLLGLGVYLNGECTHGCHFCHTAYRQFPCCGAFEPGCELRAPQIEKVLSELQGQTVALSLLGGDIFAYQDLDRVGRMIASRGLGPSTRFHAHCDNVASNLDRLASFAQWGCGLNMLVTADVSSRCVERVWRTASSTGVDTRVAFVLESRADYLRACAMRDRLSLRAVSFRPLFNGRNERYFSRSVFTRVQDLVKRRPPLRGIHANAVVNRGAFGRLFISSSGDYYTARYGETIGNLSECSMVEVLSRGLEDGSAWTQTRSRVEPCRECVFQLLCPPLSGYEQVFERSDLCHIWGRRKRGLTAVMSPDKGEAVRDGLLPT